MNGNGDFGLLPAIVVRPQPIANHLLEPPDGGFNPCALVVAGYLLPAETSPLGGRPKMTIALRRICLGGLALDRRGSRGHDDCSIGIARNDGRVNVTRVVGTVAGE